jgi:hypothetical protein
MALTSKRVDSGGEDPAERDGPPEQSPHYEPIVQGLTAVNTKDSQQPFARGSAWPLH